MPDTTLWLQISAGQCPAECEWVVARLAPILVNELTAISLEVTVISTIAGAHPGDLKSILLRVTGRAAQSLVANWLGTIQWIGVSPYRPHHKRKNWFVSIASFDEPDTGHWDTQLVKIEAMRASGPGGQHVNRTNSAVRVTHIPTNITTSAQEERSQHLNRRLALARLAKLLATRDAEAQQSVVDAQWRQHHSLIRGNPIRIYKGTDFTKLDM